MEHLDTKTNAKKKKIFVAILVGQIILVILAHPHFLDFALSTCKSCTYIDNDTPPGFFRNPLFFAFGYSLFGLYLNYKTVVEFKKPPRFALLFLTFMDMLLIPLSMILSIAYFRNKGLSIIGLKEIFNPYIIVFAVFCKHIIILAINDFILKPKEIRSS